MECEDEDLLTPNGNTIDEILNGKKNGKNRTGLNFTNDSQVGNETSDNNRNEMIETMTKNDVAGLPNSMNEKAQLEIKSKTD